MLLTHWPQIPESNKTQWNSISTSRLAWCTDIITLAKQKLLGRGGSLLPKRTVPTLTTGGKILMNSQKVIWTKNMGLCDNKRGESRKIERWGEIRTTRKIVKETSPLWQKQNKKKLPIGSAIDLLLDWFSGGKICHLFLYNYIFPPIIL